MFSILSLPEIDCTPQNRAVMVPTFELIVVRVFVTLQCFISSLCPNPVGPVVSVSFDGYQLHVQMFLNANGLELKER